MLPVGTTTMCTSKTLLNYLLNTPRKQEYKTEICTYQIKRRYIEQLTAMITQRYIGI